MSENDIACVSYLVTFLKKGKVSNAGKFIILCQTLVSHFLEITLVQIFERLSSFCFQLTNLNIDQYPFYYIFNFNQPSG